MKFIATLPSGATADVDEIWKVVHAQLEAAQPKEPHTPAPPENGEELKYRYNRVTHSVEPIEPMEPIDNGD